MLKLPAVKLFKRGIPMHNARSVMTSVIIIFFVAIRRISSLLII